MIVNLPPEMECQVKEAAARQGLDTDAFVRNAVEAKLQIIMSDLAQPLAPQQRARAFREWADGHPRTTSLLSDEAMCRETLYGERG